MDFNPHSQRFTELHAQVKQLAARETELNSELRWYDTFDIPLQTQSIETNRERAEQLQAALTSLEKQIDTNTQNLAATRSSTRTLLNPANWFAADQVALRLRSRQLRATDAKMAQQKTSLAIERKNVLASANKIRSEVQRHKEFDRERRQHDLADIRQTLTVRKQELAVVASRKQQVDEALSPLLEEMQRLATQKSTAEAVLGRAQDYEDQLSSASDSYERAMIHEQCEREFGESRPRGIISQQQRQIRQIARDYEKVSRRAEEVGRKAAREITTIVVDGNNVCYQSGAFIGISAIEALAPEISKKYSVTIVFDSAIRRMVRLNDSQIQSRLAPNAKVHVVASKQLADETVLDLASADPGSYVLSNDRFADFNDKSVVKEGRIIRHEIVDGHIFVHDLGINATWKGANNV
jgi:hypothetical protein